MVILDVGVSLDQSAGCTTMKTLTSVKSRRIWNQYGLQDNACHVGHCIFYHWHKLSGPWWFSCLRDMNCAAHDLEDTGWTWSVVILLPKSYCSHKYWCSHGFWNICEDITARCIASYSILTTAYNIYIERERTSDQCFFVPPGTHTNCIIYQIMYVLNCKKLLIATSAF